MGDPARCAVVVGYLLSAAPAYEHVLSLTVSSDDKTTIGNLDQARVVREPFVSDKTQSEIALEMGLPLGAVKSCLGLAMVRLRGFLEGAA
jgi:hypothetical protein